MTLAQWMLLLAALLPLFVAWIGKQGARDFDNAAPRAWAERQGAGNRGAAEPVRGVSAVRGRRARRRVRPRSAGADRRACVVFLAARLAYTAAYLSDRANTRSAVWAVGFACVVWLFVLPV